MRLRSARMRAFCCSARPARRAFVQQPDTQSSACPCLLTLGHAPHPHPFFATALLQIIRTATSGPVL